LRRTNAPMNRASKRFAIIVTSRRATLAEVRAPAEPLFWIVHQSHCRGDRHSLSGRGLDRFRR
jgi:hypothetical protein